MQYFINHYKKLVENVLKRKHCNEYWNSANSSKRNEKILIEIVDVYNELHDLVRKGKKETTPVYKELTYSSEKIVDQAQTRGCPQGASSRATFR